MSRGRTSCSSSGGSSSGGSSSGSSSLINATALKLKPVSKIKTQNINKIKVLVNDHAVGLAAKLDGRIGFDYFGFTSTRSIMNSREK